ncbi:MAG: helix-turn-helix domain-containing protein [Victivallaceae bacterium]|nr:putative DNA binding domain-containing protein [Victivallaceae bacterium]
MSENGKINFRSLIYRQVESDTLDYKAAMNWLKIPQSTRAKFVRHCLALANTRGGCVVVGVGEDASGHPSVYTGLSREQAHSFDPTTVGTFINRHVDPAIDFTVERPLIDGKRYAVFVIKPFTTLPHVCSSSLSGELQQGVFYIRTTDASSRPAYRAGELHDLIQRALRNQRELLGKMLRGLLYENRVAGPGGDTDDRGRFDEARRHLRDFFLRRREPANACCRLELSAFPEVFDEGRFTIDFIRSATLSVLDRESSLEYLTSEELNSGYAANTGIRVFPPEAQKLWQLTTSGMCFFIANLPKVGPEADLKHLSGILNGALGFAANLYTELGFADELITFDLRLQQINPENAVGGPPQVKLELTRSAADWQIGRQDHLKRLLGQLAEQLRSYNDKKD